MILVFLSPTIRFTRPWASGPLGLAKLKKGRGEGLATWLPCIHTFDFMAGVHQKSVACRCRTAVAMNLPGKKRVMGSLALTSCVICLLHFTHASLCDKLRQVLRDVHVSTRTTCATPWHWQQPWTGTFAHAYRVALNSCYTFVSLIGHTPCSILICRFVNEWFLGTHIERWCETLCVIDIGLESVSHGENECRGQP